jgi:hypothetical protein
VLYPLSYEGEPGVAADSPPEYRYRADPCWAYPATAPDSHRFMRNGCLAGCPDSYLS